MCHVSRVKCHFFIFIFFGQTGGVSRGRVGYQRGLPRQVEVRQELDQWPICATIMKGYCSPGS